MKNNHFQPVHCDKMSTSAAKAIDLLQVNGPSLGYALLSTVQRYILRELA